MINLAQFKELQHDIFHNVKKVERLEVLNRQFVDCIQSLWTEVHYAGYDGVDDVIEDAQASLENIMAAIDSAIAQAKRNADEYNRELLNKIFCDAKESA